ncbi:MAG: hypothetical protein MUO28_05505, partial [Desulfobacterales bacterium]|nr:hypothetical protein [Desulfobacterales bacterium]
MERLRGTPFGVLAQAFTLIDWTHSDKIVYFLFYMKTAIRSLGERLAQLRPCGNYYLAKLLLNSASLFPLFQLFPGPFPHEKILLPAFCPL